MASGLKCTFKLLKRPQHYVYALSCFNARLCHNESTETVPTFNTPLHGIKVIDLTRVLAGPYCTMIFGDLGADVIKVEIPEFGDDTRMWGPPWLDEKNSAYFVAINRNKKSLSLNLKLKEGQDILKNLVKGSDVLVENYIPGKLQMMGLGYEDLKKINPKLIYTSITGFGQSGPYATRGGYDVIAAAVGGLMHITGPRGGEPCRVGVAMTDLSTGLYAYGAIMAALLYRQKTGKGQHIDCNLLSTQVATLTHIASNYLNCDVEAERWGTGHGSIVPYQAFKTKDDRYMIIGAGNNKLFTEACEKLGLPELASDPRYLDNAKRVANRDSLVSTLSRRFREKNLDEWNDTLEGSTFPYGPINSMQRTFSDPQVIHNDMIQEIDTPHVGKVRVPGPAVQYSESDVVLQRPPPVLGQHNEEVLKGLGYSSEDIANLRESGVIG